MTLSRLQRGLSMIELMVAVALSSFLILGVTQIYIDNKSTYRFQQGQSENQEGSRYSLIFLQQELAKAGYRRRPDVEPVEAFPTFSGTDCSFDAGQTIKRLSASSVCIRYQPRDEKDLDCQGNAVADESTFPGPYTKANEVFIEKIAFDSATGELTCTREGMDPAVMMSGLADLRFLFGVGTASDSRSVKQYLAAPNNSLPIVSVRFITLARSSNPGLRDAVTADEALKNWKDFSGASDEEVTAIKGADQNQIYQFSQNTVTLRNLSP